MSDEFEVPEDGTPTASGSSQSSVEKETGRTQPDASLLNRRRTQPDVPLLNRKPGQVSGRDLLSTAAPRASEYRKPASFALSSASSPPLNRLEQAVSQPQPAPERVFEPVREPLPSFGPVFEDATLTERFHLIFRQLNVIPTLETPLIIGITSSVRGEGRTFTALGLAQSIAQQIPLPVLLLEADLGQPSLASDLGLPNQGLCEYLRGEMELDDLTRPTALPDMAVILAGDCKEEPIKVLRTERLSSLLASLIQQYAAIVVDMPPLAMTAESTRLISQVDCVLMVVEAATTPAKLARAALGIIPAGKRTGVVLNRTRQAFGPFGWLRRLFNK